MKHPQIFFNHTAELINSLPDKKDQLELLLDIGKELPSMPNIQKTSQNQIQGCATIAYLAVEISNDGYVRISGDSESLFGKSYLAIIISAFNNSSVNFILEEGDRLVTDFLKQSGLTAGLLPSRINSFGMIFKHLKQKIAEKS